MGIPPKWYSVPYPVGVKKAGIPAPPARILSAKLPWGVSSTSTSPHRNWLSNKGFSPIYDDVMCLTWWVCNSNPGPQSAILYVYTQVHGQKCEAVK